jgi:hypothetical protein
MSGHWPPEWEDPDAGYPGAWVPDGWHPDAGHPDPGVLAEYLTGLIDDAHGGELAMHLASCAECAELGARLSQVPSALASVPPSSLPTAFEARISGAIAAEAATRAETTRAEATGTRDSGTEATGAETAGAVDAKATARSSHPEEEFSPTAAEGGSATAAKRRSRLTGPRRSRTPGQAGSRAAGRRRRLLLSPAAIGTLVACLFIAGFGYLVTRTTSSSSSSLATSAGTSVQASPSGLQAPESRPFAGSVPEKSSSAASSGFVVTESGTTYRRATLAGQVRDVLAADGSSSSSSRAPSAVAPAASSSPGASGTGSLVPSAALAGCVSHLTGGVPPTLVDRASYDGSPAYVIAVPSRAWVVGLGCTAADPHLIASVSLAGLSGVGTVPGVWC